MALTLIVAYDVTSDRRRAKLAGLLQAWGDRLQYSVFVCVLDESHLGALESEIKRIIDPDTDSVALVRQCAACWKAIGAMGQREIPEGATYWASF
ncbi:MAG: CRISPR-associated endonuclease Cas2 [Gordonia sp. (in: high G+C Gram-positive bacteria)]|uniref:CRISPR-associated endonuclease Cas2 n=1 Tax=Gordonia sp. (in: high G+C Gram-positive bacteria) TaxID=84139 RepID=UPI0039E24CB1